MVETGTAKPLSSQLADQWRFLKGLAARPGMTGAIAPSGPGLARLMASFVDVKDDLPVLELGPGTGVVTAALLARGVPAERLTAIEYSPEFCRLLRERLPGVTFVEGDAYDLAATLPPDRRGPFAAIVSSLPLIVRPPAERQALVEAGLDRMAKGKPFIQFSYSLFPPVAPVPGRFTVTHSRWVLLNLPPARVWVYRRA